MTLFYLVNDYEMQRYHKTRIQSLLGGGVWFDTKIHILLHGIQKNGYIFVKTLNPKIKMYLSAWVFGYNF